MVIVVPVVKSISDFSDLQFLPVDNTCASAFALSDLTTGRAETTGWAETTLSMSTKAELFLSPPSSFSAITTFFFTVMGAWVMQDLVATSSLAVLLPAVADVRILSVHSDLTLGKLVVTCAALGCKELHSLAGVSTTSNLTRLAADPKLMSLRCVGWDDVPVVSSVTPFISFWRNCVALPSMLLVQLVSPVPLLLSVRDGTRDCPAMAVLGEGPCTLSDTTFMARSGPVQRSSAASLQCTGNGSLLGTCTFFVLPHAATGNGFSAVTIMSSGFVPVVNRLRSELFSGIRCLVFLAGAGNPVCKLPLWVLFHDCTVCLCFFVFAGSITIVLFVIRIPESDGAATWTCWVAHAPGLLSRGWSHIRLVLCERSGRRSSEICTIHTRLLSTVIPIVPAMVRFVLKPLKYLQHVLLSASVISRCRLRSWPTSAVIVWTSSALACPHTATPVNEMDPWVSE